MDDATLPAPDADTPRLELGAQAAGRYRILKFLGAGAMGEVYAAEDLIVGTTVALKALRPELAGSSHALERFRREIAVARKVTDRHVCRTHDVGEHAGRVFLTMELLEGRTLAERVRTDGPLPIEEVEAIAQQLVLGLAALHDAGVVHRDFKSANVLLVAKNGVERAVITDFGLARSMEDRDAKLTTESGLLGTPAYMAPEQVEGREATPASDIYALGVTLFELVTGTLPFREDTALATATARLQRDAPTASSFRPGTPARWNAIIARCLARDPARRFASVRDVIGETPRMPSRRRVLLGGLGAAAAAGLGFALWSRREQTPSAAPASSPPAKRLVAVLPVEGAPEDTAVRLALSIDLHDALATAGLPMLGVDGGFLFANVLGTAFVLSREPDPTTAARAIDGVTNVVRTSLVAANGLAVNVVIDGRSGRFERPRNEAMLLVDDVARYIAAELGVRAPHVSRDAGRLDASAYEQYGAALGVLLDADRDPGDGLAAFDALLAAHPMLTRASARLAERLVDIGQQFETEAEVMIRVDRATSIVDQVLAAYPDHPLALLVRAAASRIKYDWSASDRDLDRALELAPTHERIRYHKVFNLAMEGKHNDSIELQLALVSANSLSSQTQQALTSGYYYTRRYDDAIRHSAKIRDQLNPRDRMAQASFEILSYVELARFDDALALAKEMEKADDPYWNSNLVTVYALAGKRDDAVRWRTKLGDTAGLMMGALMDDAMGDIEAALRQLEKLVDSHNLAAQFLKIERFSARLRSEPRFQKLLARVGLS